MGLWPCCARCAGRASQCPMLTHWPHLWTSEVYLSPFPSCGNSYNLLGTKSRRDFVPCQYPWLAQVGIQSLQSASAPPLAVLSTSPCLGRNIPEQPCSFMLPLSVLTADEETHRCLGGHGSSACAEWLQADLPLAGGFVSPAPTGVHGVTSRGGTQGTQGRLHRQLRARIYPGWLILLFHFVGHPVNKTCKSRELGFCGT